MKLLRILQTDRSTPARKHAVRLTDAERRALRRLIARGTAPARTLSHARILLKADASPAGPSWTDERIRDALVTEVAAWTARRNAAPATIDWHFTTTDARVKLRRLYPSL